MVLSEGDSPHAGILAVAEITGGKYIEDDAESLPLLFYISYPSYTVNLASNPMLSACPPPFPPLLSLLVL